MGITTVETQTKTVVTTMEKPHKRVGIFGGTFNPPHYAHLVIAQHIQEELELDRIHFLPTAEPSHTNGKTTIPADYRVDMVELAIEDNPNFCLDLTEVSRGGKSYTVETMRALTEANPDVEYYFIIGQDMVLDLPTWDGIDELMELVQFVAAKRPGYAGESPYPIIWVDVPELALSSSLIRQRVSEGKSIQYLTPPRVIDYIKTEGLYTHDNN